MRQALAGGKYDPNWEGYAGLTPEITRAYQAAAAAEGLPVGVLMAMGLRETHHRPDAINRGDGGKGDDSMGVMQLGKDARRGTGLSDADALNAEKNIRAGAKWLRMKIEQNGGDLRSGVRGYNGSGPAAEAYAAEVMANAARFGSLPGGASGVTRNAPKAAAPRVGLTSEDGNTNTYQIIKPGMPGPAQRKSLIRQAPRTDVEQAGIWAAVDRNDALRLSQDEKNDPTTIPPAKLRARQVEHDRLEKANAAQRSGQGQGVNNPFAPKPAGVQGAAPAGPTPASTPAPVAKDETDQALLDALGKLRGKK
jgi:hypothetical protein